MKKQIASILTAALILSVLSGCSSGAEGSGANSGSSSTSEKTSTSSSSSFSEETSNSSSEISLTEQKAFYDDTFQGLNSNYVMGPSMTYDEVMEMITSQASKEHGIYLDSFYLVETIRALSTEESKQLNGWGLICEGSTIYEVKILSDLISGEKVNRTEKILVGAGTPELQDSGDPAYAPGERFTITLAKPIEGEDFLQTPGGYMFRYDVAANGIELYSRKSEIDSLNLPSSTNIDESVITSTTKNPAVYTQKVELNSLVNYLRSDWQKNKISAHYEQEAGE